MSKQFAIVVAVIKDGDGNILVSKRIDENIPAAHNKWDLVGGKIEFGEDPEKAVVREVKEETGFDVEVVRLLPKVFPSIWETKSGDKFQTIVISYECRIVGGELNKVMDHKISDIKMTTIEEIKKLDTMHLVVPIIELL